MSHDNERTVAVSAKARRETPCARQEARRILKIPKRAPKRKSRGINHRRSIKAIGANSRESRPVRRNSMKYVYPAIFHPEEEGGYSIVFPDIARGATQGETVAECMDMAEDFLCSKKHSISPHGSTPAPRPRTSTSPRRSSRR